MIKKCKNIRIEPVPNRDFFLFTFFFALFCKNIWSKIFLQNYTPSAVGDDGRDLALYPMAVGARVVL
jgi:hypothetical protein